MTTPARTARPWIQALALFACLLASTGCSAMAKYDATAEPAPFSATSNNLGSIYIAAKGYEPKRRTAFDFVLSPVAIPIWLATVPVSAGWDLLTLPYDLLRSDSAEWSAAHERRWTKVEAACEPACEPATTKGSGS